MMPIIILFLSFMAPMGIRHSLTDSLRTDLWFILISCALLVWFLNRLVFSTVHRIFIGRACKSIKGQVVPASFLHIGFPVKIHILSNQNEPEIHGVMEWLDRRWIRIQTEYIPRSRLKAGLPLEIIVVGDTFIYRFNTLLGDENHSENATVLSVRKPDWMERVQRRSYFRIPLNIPAVVNRINISMDRMYPIRCKINDLSGGGIRISSKEGLEIGMQVRIHFPVEIMNGASFEARVLKCDEAGNNTEFPFKVHCEFLYISEDTRNNIINYCFCVQKKMLMQKNELMNKDDTK